MLLLYWGQPSLFQHQFVSKPPIFYQTLRPHQSYGQLSSAQPFHVEYWWPRTQPCYSACMPSKRRNSKLSFYVSDIWWTFPDIANPRKRRGLSFFRSLTLIGLRRLTLVWLNAGLFSINVPKTNHTFIFLSYPIINRWRRWEMLLSILHVVCIYACCP